MISKLFVLASTLVFSIWVCCVMSSSVSFFSTPTAIRLADLCPRIDCELRTGDNPDTEISRISPIETAGEDSLTFLTSHKYLKASKTTRASAIICPPEYADLIDKHICVLISADPHTSFALALSVLFPDALRPKSITGETAISSDAFVHPTASLESDIIIEAGCVIGEHSVIGTGTHIAPNTVIGANVRIGRHTSIGANATLSHCIIGDNVILHSGVLIGSDGFGFAPGERNTKVPQTGRVIIQDDVELGAGTAVDRGTMGDTIIGEGTKMDNLVMIGHNVVIGRHCLFAGQCSIAGSTIIEDYVVMGGRTAIADHIHIGKGAKLAGNSSVFAGDVPAGVRWGGSPARDLRHWIRDMSRQRREARKMSNKGV